MINLSTYERAWRCARAGHPDGTREVTMRASAASAPLRAT